MIKENIELIVSVLIACVLVVLAVAHKLQFGTEQYRDSLLIRFESFFVILALGGLIVVFCSIVVSIFTRKWRKAGLGVVSLALVFLLVALSVYLDPATLIYMT